jgi:predicted patatin/cPLA2 family phospholipase
MNNGKKHKKRRSLMLAGGALKVGFQAGVLQVWLDEAGLEFDHADGVSGGVFNLAMYCQGMAGKEIADNWRNINPAAGFSLNWKQYYKLIYAKSIATLDKYRESIFTGWGLDWGLIRNSHKEATFNVYNFSKHVHEVIEPGKMTEDFFVACISLPIWFPPVIINNDIYIDAVFITDSNIEEAINRGADEIWVIWTVSDKNEWHDGFVANYFQIIEASANGHFNKIVKRINENNIAIGGGRTGEFGRHIDLKILKAEVPVHYLLNFSRDRIAETVEMGVTAARKWCVENQIPMKDTDGKYPPVIHATPSRLSFTEVMKGYIMHGEKEYDTGYKKGKLSGKKDNHLMFKLTIEVDDVDSFITNPKHEATACGYIECNAFGGKQEVEKGTFNLFVDDKDPAIKHMLYRLYFNDGPGRPLTLIGFKEIKDDPGFDLWSDTTTLYTRILEGHIGVDEDDNADVTASGIITIHMFDFLKQITTFRVEGPTLSGKTSALTRFGKMFLGKLWDVYARQILTYSPF